ncbi:acyl carrier protein phosphodiesterase [Mangrovimonas sp. YM274]|uniref:acyl carrier protein phosphodiesterase n=1 Tax=Mangrovimonas sp. YM274 TaxID=3070660 RepID=UPI0027DABBE9|nr:acyl carrier protein phosphodiesterase [Mangrovimonas sp. YM274]WMI70245.1 acyl carrier protein phosphodiesterase [Mangrovimonas sp. YM274]
MNFLAHIYLSGDDELVRIGNFMADGIKGSQYKTYPLDIQIGILLHREIDTFTDAHPIVRQSTKRLHPNYSHYSGVIVDILYDHFLAKNWSQYSNTPLHEYVEDFYDSLTTHGALLTSRTKHLMPYMIADNWLVSYAEIEGIQRVLNGMNRRTNHKSGMHAATYELKLYYTEFETEFTDFFEQLRVFSKDKLIQLQRQHHPSS